MKNVTERQLKKCIFLRLEEYRDIIQKLFGPEVTIEWTVEGLDVHTPTDALPTGEIHEGLERYFDVRLVTSIHSDHCEEEPGVWITYKDNKITNN